VLRRPELGAERKGGAMGALYRRRGGEWGMGRGQRHAAVRRGASAAVGVARRGRQRLGHGGTGWCTHERHATGSETREGGG
jgi:hypothetical protein